MFREGASIKGLDFSPSPLSDAGFRIGPALVWVRVHMPGDPPPLTFTVTEIIQPKKQAAPKGRRN